MRISNLQNIMAGTSMTYAEQNASRKIADDLRTDRFGRSKDIYRSKPEMQSDDRVKWFDGIACTGCVPFAAFLLKSFGDERISDYIRKAPEDSNVFIMFAHVDPERDDVNIVCSNLIIKYHGFKIESNGRNSEYPDYVHFKFTHTYRCSMEEWEADKNEILQRIKDKNLNKR